MTKVIFSKNQVKDLNIDELFEEASKVVDLILPESNLQYIQDLIYRIRPSQISTCNSAAIKEKEFGLMLRHDVDHSLDSAYIMSEVENLHNISSTYFFLHPDNFNVKNYMGFFDQKGKLQLSKKFIEVVKIMQSKGHEIGLHYDLITLSLNTGLSTNILLNNILNSLSKCDIKIKGCVAHGNALARKYKYNNYLIFKECKKPKRRDLFISKLKEFNKLDFDRRLNDLNLNKLSLGDFGLNYEASFIKREFTITDSGGGMKLEDKRQKEKTRLLKKGFSLTEYELFFNKFGFCNLEKGDISLLVHPDWWCPVKRISNVSYNKKFIWRHK